MEKNIAPKKLGTPYRMLDFDVHDENDEDPFVCDDGEKFINERHSKISKDKIPAIGMEFDCEETAYKFYNAYAKAVGFSIRRSVAHNDRGKILDRIFCCSCQGKRGKDKRDVIVKSHRPETRTCCLAMVKIDARQTGKYIIESSGIAPRAGFELLTKQMGSRESVGFTFADYKNYIQSKRKFEMRKGDTGGVLEYLQEKQLQDPNFFYAIQVDEEDMITNIFWADGQMMADYAHFGDVVCFDTTYRKNKDGRPFALFVGVNHHKQTTIFGAALLYAETTDSFMWLFDTFVRAMLGKKPITILTDQDIAMGNALKAKWPETQHRLCIWHIYQNAASHLSSVFSSFVDFSKDFKSCIYDFDEEADFLSAWQKMLEKYGLQTNEWLRRMFGIKEKWALVYGRQMFCGDITTTQRSESMNSALKRYVSYKNNLLQFFRNFDKLVSDRRFKELEADLRTNHSTPVLSVPTQILKHAVNVYTHEVFELFQKELTLAYDASMVLCNATENICEYKVTLYKAHHHHIVKYDSSNGEISCGCKKFEFAGLLCSHALKVLTTSGVNRISEAYIKKRWTKKAKKGVSVTVSHESVEELDESMKEEYEKRMIGVRYRELCQLNNQLVTRAALTSETTDIVKKGMLMYIEEVDSSLENITVRAKNNTKEQLGSRGEVDKRTLGTSQTTEDASKNLGTVTTENAIRGWKAKERNKSSKRPKSGLEKATRKNKQKHSGLSSTNNSTDLHGFSENNTKNKSNVDGLSHGVAIQSNSFSSSSENRIHSFWNFPRAESFQAGQLLHTNVTEHLNVPRFYPRNHINTSLTQLLQEQLAQSHQTSNEITPGSYIDSNNGDDDAPGITSLDTARGRQT